ncbi:MAG: AAA family ATPase [Pyrinomonadaceae bacterium]|nr:AAA family ATPase [Pyrinomonadaceae bacterium]
MHITRIELENIKSHAESKFEFERGTTAIMGENGSGKTTLIEAVAWTLFDMLDYKKKGFVRRGAKKGTAKVTFESGLDERRYVVHRDTNTGYFVYDPRLKTRIADKKEEVTRFLWQHIGVEVGTDLEALFRRAIGVPQGTFTAIFLESPTERKKAFDKLLKVEEYRQGADKLRETARYIEGKIITAREEIARAKGELTRFAPLETDLKEIEKKLKTVEKTIVGLEKDARARRKGVEKFERIESKVSELNSTLEKLSADKSRAEMVFAQKETEKAISEKASLEIKEVEEDYHLHQKALGMIKELERERVKREEFQNELAKIEAAIVNVKAEEKSVAEDLKRALGAHKEIEMLKPQVENQEILEKQRKQVGEKLADAKSAKSQLESLDKKIQTLREQFKGNQQKLTEAREKSAEAKHLGEWQRRDNELQKDLANLRAKLETDKKFQEEIRNGLCPILTEKCLNMKPGEKLEDFLSTKFVEIRSQISDFESEQIKLARSLAAAREAEKFAAKLENLVSREKEITAEGKNLNEERERIEKLAKNFEQVEADLKDVESKLSSLDNPKAKIKMLEKESGREISIREKRTNIESNLERLESDRRLKIEQLETYKDLDSNWKEYTDKRDRTAEAHRKFVANEAQAKSLKEKEKELKTAKKDLEKLEKSLKKTKKEFEKQSKGFDREKYAAEKFKLAELEKLLIETTTNRGHLKDRGDEIKGEIKRLEEIGVLMDEQFKEKERLEKVGEATSFIRSTLKEAAPQVAKNYVYHVSIEANQMFRDIFGNAERTLKWEDDYGISLEEGGYDRPFQNLSGGEQTAAALSVRLALLKQLSDVRIAFFDEPTMNMDAERRERLAEQISTITAKQTFDQLFVISHDDTFEGYVDNVITLGEVNG